MAGALDLELACDFHGVSVGSFDPLRELYFTFGRFFGKGRPVLVYPWLEHR